MRHSVWIRSIAPSFLSALVAIIPLIALLVYGLSVLPNSGHADPAETALSQSIDGDNIDDGFGRSLIVIIMAIPSAYLVLVLGLYFIGSVLVTIGIQRRAWFLLAANIIAIAVPLSMLRHSFVNEDAKMALYVIIFTVISILPATWCWWATVVSPKRKSAQSAGEAKA